MFDNKELTKEIVKNPTITQSLVLKELNSRYKQQTNADLFIGDPNMGLIYLLEAFSSISSHIMRIEDRSFETLYPKRATTFDELYNHISDFDYAQLNATPCEFNVKVIFNVNWIIENAIDVDKTYKQIIIPDTTIVSMGNKEFGIYYPILIKVNKNNNLISVEYDLSVPNPLKTYKTNLLLEDYIFTQDGVSYLSIAFTTYQFRTYDIQIEPNITQNTGFNQKFSFDSGYFYAARIYAVNSKTNQSTELSYTLSQSVYDVNKPTVLIEIFNDKREVVFQIPNIYFETKLVDNNIKVSIYTTEGRLNEIINTAEVADMLIKFDEKSSIYSSMLTNATYFSVLPYNQIVLDGGADPLGFEALKDNVVNGTLNYTAPITNMQLKNHVEKYGFKLTKYIDNITDRIYYASASLITSDKKVAPIVNTAVKLQVDDIDGSISTILSFPDSISVILPNTIFRYDDQFNVSYPLKNEELDRFNKLSKKEMVDVLNSTIYTRQPYHILLSFKSKYPKAQSINLMNPALQSLMFIKEHTESTIQLSVLNVKIEHLDNGTGGYKFYFYVKRSVSLANDDPAKFQILFCYKKSSSQVLYRKADYVGLDQDSNLDVFTTVLETTYQMDLDDTIHCKFNLDNDRLADTRVSFSDSYSLYACVMKSQYPNIKNQADLISGMPTPILNDLIVLSEQTATISLGENLNKQIFNSVNISWNNSIYQYYTDNIPYLYTSDEFQRQGGQLVTKIINRDGKDTIVPYTLFSKGEVKRTQTTFTVYVSKKSDLGTSVLYLNNVSSLLPGLRLTSAYLDLNTVITSIDKNTNSITISTKVLNDVPPGHIIYVENGMYNFIVKEDQKDSKSLTVTGDSTRLHQGLRLYGFDVCENKYDKVPKVTSVLIDSVTIQDSNTAIITLQTPTLNTVKANTIITILNDNAPLVYQYKAGDIVIDSNGDPIITKTKTNIYMVDIIQFDARLYASEVISDVNYINNLPAELSQKSHALDDIRDDMLERTYLYYKPFRTIGSANFITGNQVLTKINLNLSLSLIYYVPIAVFKSSQLKTVMINATIELLTEYFKTNTLISTTDIASLLKTHFSDNVISIDISGIDDDSQRQTIIVDDDYVSPSVAYKLVLREDNTIALDPDIDVVFKTLTD